MITARMASTGRQKGHVPPISGVKWNSGGSWYLKPSQYNIWEQQSDERTNTGRRPFVPR